MEKPPTDPPIIVAEVSKTWPNTDKTPIAKLFEGVINSNLQRSYFLKDWKLSQIHLGNELNETIIAVFEHEQLTDNFLKHLTQ